MCGIVGVVSRAGLGPGYPIDAMRDALAHRGPDDRGTWWSADRRVGLGHRRLAVLDVTTAGHQPMRSASGLSTLVFNGEIYNYRDLRAELEQHGVRFRTGTDTEVILEGYEVWGLDVVPRLNGMFAFALADAGAGRVLLARDRAGEKPLFIGRFGHRVAFGSELKALLADDQAPRRIDPEALDFYLAYGYVPGPRCLLRGFQKLAPAHALTIDVETGDERQWAYWSMPAPRDVPADATADAPALIDELDSLLEDAVTRQMVADVPIGVLLSGGIDSSLVAAMAVRRSPGRVRTFTMTFPGHPSHDEGPHARMVAAHLGTDHAELEADGAVVEVLPEIARQFDEPIADSAIVPTWLLSRLIRRQATVALGGDGSDELFGGYPHYQWVIDVARLRRVMPAPARALASRLGTALPTGTRGRNHLIGLAGDLGDTIAHINMYFDRATRRRLVPASSGRSGAANATSVTPEAWRSGLWAGVHRSARARHAHRFRVHAGGRLPRARGPRQHARRPGSARAVPRLPRHRVRDAGLAGPEGDA